MSGTGKVLQLAAGDNVLIVASAIRAGERVQGPAGEIVVAEGVQLGHKVAARTISRGEQVVRFGMPIGSATCRIAAGDWVHTHNLKSDYIATFGSRGGSSDG